MEWIRDHQTGKSPILTVFDQDDCFAVNGSQPLRSCSGQSTSKFTFDSPRTNASEQSNEGKSHVKFHSDKTS